MTPHARATLVERWQRARANVDRLKRDIGRTRRALHTAAADVRAVEDEAQRLGITLRAVDITDS